MIQFLLCLFGFHGATEIGTDAKPECRNSFKQLE